MATYTCKHCHSTYDSDDWDEEPLDDCCPECYFIGNILDEPETASGDEDEIDDDDFEDADGYDELTDDEVEALDLENEFDEDDEADLEDEDEFPRS